MLVSDMRGNEQPTLLACFGEYSTNMQKLATSMNVNEDKNQSITEVWNKNGSHSLGHLQSENVNLNNGLHLKEG